MPSFLSPLLDGASENLVMLNLRTGLVVANRLLPAFDSRTRSRGLLQHQTLAEGEAMLIAPTNAIHSFFMRFPIDVLFVARDGRIVKIRPSMPAWRMTAAWGAYAAVEMRAGEAARTGTVAGDTLVMARDPGATVAIPPA